MLVLGLDFETTFTDPISPPLARIVEIGAVLYDTEAHVPVVLMSRTVWAEDYQYDPRITGLTGLQEEHLKKYGTSPKRALEKLLRLMGESDVVVAHNGREFDKVVLESECKRHELACPVKHWVDTTSDVPYPPKIDTRKLDHLGPAHAFLNPFAHRALFDVCTMLKVMSCYNFDEVLALSKVPEIRVRAQVAKPFGPTEEQGKLQTAQAKARGYRFDGASKSWIKRIKENQFAEESVQAPFPVVMVK